jgi:hypothetical protein
VVLWNFCNFDFEEKVLNRESRVRGGVVKKSAVFPPKFDRFFCAASHRRSKTVG